MSLDKLPLSVIVLTFNEELNIGPCLESIVPWAQEVFVVDSGSTDRTLDIVSKYGAKVLTHPFENYSQQRNWAQDNVPLSHEWVFHIDADERVSPELVDRLHELFAETSLSTQNLAPVSANTVWGDQQRISFGGGRDLVEGGREAGEAVRVCGAGSRSGTARPACSTHRRTRGGGGHQQ